MTLNIKNPRAHELAAQLVGLTGENLTTAVIRALEKRLQEVKRERSRRSTAERVMEFGRRFSAGMPKDCHSGEHSLLYGEDGLPK